LWPDRRARLALGQVAQLTRPAQRRFGRLLRLSQPALLDLDLHLAVHDLHPTNRVVQLAGQPDHRLQVVRLGLQVAQVPLGLRPAIEQCVRGLRREILTRQGLAVQDNAQLPIEASHGPPRSAAKFLQRPLRL
jgi:hypothetical protein